MGKGLGLRFSRSEAAQLRIQSLPEFRQRYISGVQPAAEAQASFSLMLDGQTEAVVGTVFDQAVQHLPQAEAGIGGVSIQPEAHVLQGIQRAFSGQGFFHLHESAFHARADAGHIRQTQRLGEDRIQRGIPVQRAGCM